jgi:hypothetical protein
LVSFTRKDKIVKKLLASMLCMGLICGLGAGMVGCTKEEPKKPAVTPPAEKKAEKDEKKAEKDEKK